MTVASDIMDEDFSKADVSMTVSKWAGLLKKSHNHCSALYNGKKFIGVIEKSWLLTSRIDPETMKLSNLVNRRSKSKISLYVPRLTKDTDFNDMCRLMYTSNVHMLPVFNKEKLVGVVHVYGLLRELKDKYARTPVMDLASRKVVSVNENDDIGRAISLMLTSGVKRLPVVDKNNKLSGFVSVIDLIEKFHSSSRSGTSNSSHNTGKHSGSGVSEQSHTTSLPVSDIMSSNAVCCGEKTSVKGAIEAMLSERVSSIVVANGKDIVGIITATDILKDASSRKFS